MKTLAAAACALALLVVVAAPFAAYAAQWQADASHSVIQIVGKVVADKVAEVRANQASAGASMPQEAAAQAESPQEAAVQEGPNRETAQEAGARDAAPQDADVPEGSLQGETLQEAPARTAVSQPAVAPADLPEVDYMANVGVIMQNDVMMGGCELVSLAIALESAGVEADLDTIAYEHLDMDGSFSTGYAGDPYYAGGGFPPGIAAAANSYLESIGSSLRAYDITGSSFDDLEAFVARGYPVLTWTTMGYDDPFFSDIFEDDAEWYDNEHCVVTYGFDEDGELVLISDPLEGFVELERSRFAELFELCGNRALVLADSPALS